MTVEALASHHLEAGGQIGPIFTSRENENQASAVRCFRWRYFINPLFDGGQQDPTLQKNRTEPQTHQTHLAFPREWSDPLFPIFFHHGSLEGTISSCCPQILWLKQKTRLVPHNTK